MRGIGLALASVALAATTDIALADRYRWAGFYVGANIGGAWSDVDNSFIAPGPPNPPNFIAEDAAAISAGGSNSFSPANVAFGVHGGYNLIMGGILLGGEIDLGRLGIDESLSRTFDTAFAGPVSSSTSISAPWLLTVRPRIGLTFDNLLVYATGGLAVARIKFSETNIFDPAFNEAGTDLVGVAKTKAGWTGGGGAEFALDNHWSVTGEYLFVGLGKISTTSSTKSPYFGDPTLVTYSSQLDATSQIGRVGLNYKF